jgi:hypothetical protein
MVPPSPGIGYIDPTEQLIFDRIKEETPSTWVGLHHVGLPRHRTKPIAEIDFIVISEHGVFCLEVKGGAVRCEAGTWYAGTRQLSESPFQQVGSASADLRNYVDQLHPFVFGYGCAFPHCVFDVKGPEVLPEVVYDASSVQAGFAEYVRQLGEYWGARYRHAKRLGAADISKIHHALRPDFEATESVLHRIDEVRKQLVAFTAEQQRALEGLRENKQVVVKGGAGTGKTLIAATEAVRLADHGYKTLLTCFTKALAAKLREELGARPNLEVCHIDQLVSDLIDSGGTAGMIPDDVSEADRLEVYARRVGGRRKDRETRYLRRRRNRRGAGPVDRVKAPRDQWPPRGRIGERRLARFGIRIRRCSRQGPRGIHACSAIWERRPRPLRSRSTAATRARSQIGRRCCRIFRETKLRSSTGRPSWTATGTERRRRSSAFERLC